MHRQVRQRRRRLVLTAIGAASGVDEAGGAKYGWPPCVRSPHLAEAHKEASAYFSALDPKLQQELLSGNSF